MPYPTYDLSLQGPQNRMIQDELTYKKSALKVEYQNLFTSLTSEQRAVYHKIMKAVDNNNGGMFFLYGYGGTGKTFVWKTLSSALRCQGKIVLTVASSGIASLLLTGGRTAHSRFAILININEDSVCHITPNSNLAELIKQTSLIIWDEAPMIHKHSFEAMDRTFTDILRCQNMYFESKPFGGKVIVFGGDFRQILPVVPKGSRQDIVNASLRASYLWDDCEILRLTSNMRLNQGDPFGDLDEKRKFSYWILSIGDGTLAELNDGEAIIHLPDDILIKYNGDPILAIINSIYPNITQRIAEEEYFQDRSILALTHDIVNQINDRLMELLPGEDKIYLSSDSIAQSDLSPVMSPDFYSPDFLNEIQMSGLPNHRLSLKKNVPVMLLRNIDQPAGLCNGTRLQIMRLGEHAIEAKIISGSHIGDITFIPRMRLSSSDKKMPFQFQRRQFPLVVCFAMTINKSQGQSLSEVGIDLPRPVFSHGQLYVAISRVKSNNGLKVLITDENGHATNRTTNVIYKEVLQDL